jgi:cysteine desulfurase/selenocysteine lyase
MVSSSKGVELDMAAIRADYPILEQRIHGRPLVYLDSAATSQTPLPVVRAISDFYRHDCANVHRGVHLLSQRATDLYEEARDKARRFINAASCDEIIFTRGTTEAINLLAATLGRIRVGAGDEVLISALEHHSNIVPWQMLCETVGARLRVVPMNDAGELLLDDYATQLGAKTRLVALAHVSNALGTINPVREMIALAHQRGVPVLLDGAQAVPHTAVDVRALDCDFYAFSGHKMYGPTGIGVLYGRRALLEEMPPYQGGGDMIQSVTFEKTIYNVLPYKFEAGTPNIAGAIGLGAAIDYIEAIGIETIQAHEERLLVAAEVGLEQIPGVRRVGTAAARAGVVSFVLDAAHPHDIGTILDAEGVAIRAGHHCAQPVMERFSLPATARASFAVYNHIGDVEALLTAVAKVHEVFS